MSATLSPPVFQPKTEPMVVMTTRVPAVLRRKLWVHFRDDTQSRRYNSMSHIVQLALEEYLDRHGAK